MFIEWARKYDTGSVDMRSKAKHDEWQKLLLCKQLVLNGADVLEENYKEVLIHNFKGGTPMCGMTSNQ